MRMHIEYDDFGEYVEYMEDLTEGDSGRQEAADGAAMASYTA